MKVAFREELHLNVSAINHHKLDEDCRGLLELTQLNEAKETFKFTSQLLDVKAGHLFVISGRSKADAYSIAVDFEADNGGDVPLHTCVLFKDKSGIYRTSHSKELGWGKDECSENLLSDAKNPLLAGSYFKLSIFVDSDVFIISVNEKPFCTYQAQQPPNLIKTLKISGDVEELFQVHHIRAVPPQWPSMHPSKFSSAFTSPVGAGEAILIKATPHGKRLGWFELCCVDGGSKRQIFNLKASLLMQTIVGSSQKENHE